MKKYLFLIFLLFPLMLFADTQEDVRQYALEHKVQCSRGITGCTAVFCGNGYYNEDGIFVSPSNCNTCTTKWSCNDGKTFSVSE